MSKSLSGTKTHQNLKDAGAGESQPNPGQPGRAGHGGQIEARVNARRAVSDACRRGEVRRGGHAIWRYGWRRN